MIFLVLTEGYDEPELIGPFTSKRAATAFAHENFAFEGWWPIDIRKATNPNSSAFDQTKA